VNFQLCSAPVVALASSDTTWCDKKSIDYFDLSTNNPTSWNWYFPGAQPATSTLQNPTGIYYPSYGSFDVKLVACNIAGCDSVLLTNFITEFQVPPPPVITLSNDTLFSTPAYSYQWYFNSNIIAGANGQYYVFQQPGDYFVVITDSNGCAASSFVIYTGINNISGNQVLTINPNPSDDNFIINGAPEKATANIYDVRGRTIFTSEINGPSFEFKIKAADGIYFLSLLAENKIFWFKIIVKN
jgi:PKD repeat protein